MIRAFRSENIRPPVASMTIGLAVGVTAAVVLACCGQRLSLSQHHMRSLLETAQYTALAEGDLIRVALEHQMIENDRTLIAAHDRKLPQAGRGRPAGAAGPFRHGTLPCRLRSADADLQINSPTCQACHRYPPEQRGSSRVIETRGGTVLRTVVPDSQPPGVLRLP